MAFVARIGLFFQMICVFPLLVYIFRLQFMNTLFGSIWPRYSLLVHSFKVCASLTCFKLVLSYVPLWLHLAQILTNCGNVLVSGFIKKVWLNCNSSYCKSANILVQYKFHAIVIFLDSLWPKFVPQSFWGTLDCCIGYIGDNVAVVLRSILHSTIKVSNSSQASVI